MELVVSFPLEAVGLFAFGMSGVLVALEKRMDLIGVCVLAITTACGGGMLRDVLLNQPLPAFFTHRSYLCIVALAIVVTLLGNAVLRRHHQLRRFDLSLPLDIADAVGLATFGTSAVAANAIANSIAGVVNVPGTAIGLSIITVIGRCMGAGETGQAAHYTKRLVGASYVCMLVMSTGMFLFADTLVSWFNLTPQAVQMAGQVLRACAVGNVLFWPMAFTLPNSLRAAGDAVFTMGVSLCSMFACRVALSYVMACEWGLGLGLLGVWLAMIADWVARAVLFFVRYRQGKWKKIKVIG